MVVVAKVDVVRIHNAEIPSMGVKAISQPVTTDIGIIPSQTPPSARGDELINEVNIVAGRPSEAAAFIGDMEVQCRTAGGTAADAALSATAADGNRGATGGSGTAAAADRDLSAAGRSATGTTD